MADVKPFQQAQKKRVNLVHRLSVLRNYLPGKYLGPGRNVRICNGIIRPPYSCSIVAVEHCNLSCLDCNHASPVMPRDFVDTADIISGLQNLAGVYQPRTLNLIGGEPLLHPKLVELIQAMKTVGMGKHVSIVTNAILLDKMPDQFWDEINALELSVYPKTNVNEAFLEEVKSRARKHNVRVDAFSFNKFRATFSAQGTTDPTLAKRIYTSCEIANLWGCHTISGKYLYKCPQAIYAPQIPGTRATHSFTGDGVPLGNKAGLFGKLHDYLNSDEPLSACGYCLGTVGKVRPHQFVKPEKWATYYNVPAEELIDYEKLAELEKGLGSFVEHRKLIFKIHA